MTKLNDWDDAYTNGAYIEGGDSYPARWQQRSEEFRRSLPAGSKTLDLPYAEGERRKYDRFGSANSTFGLLIFVHGGYWLRFDKSYWSYLAQGAVERGWTVAMPSYPLAPEASVAQITLEVASAITFIAEREKGPLILAGHSAGGHLVSRMLCKGSPLSPAVQTRIAHVMSISGVHDLRPLLRTAMGPQLFRSEGEAAIESPALLEPVQNTRITCWVGAQERPEFVRQNDLLANVWTGLGADVECYHAEGRHHFDVIDDLANPESDMLRRLLGYSW